MKKKQKSACSADAVKELRQNIKMMRGSSPHKAHLVFHGSKSVSAEKPAKKTGKKPRRSIAVKAALPVVALGQVFLLLFLSPPEGLAWFADGDEFFAAARVVRSIVVLAVDTLLFLK